MLNVDLQKLISEDESRYALVAATAKRARMIVDDAEKDHFIIVDKPVSIAVKELQDDVWGVCEKN